MGTSALFLWTAACFFTHTYWWYGIASVVSCIGFGIAAVHEFERR